jgi:N-acetylneuraminic acid mutarotase
MRPPSGNWPATPTGLKVNLPSSADGDLELAAGPHLFRIRALAAADSPATRQEAGAVFYGSQRFLAASDGQEAHGLSWRTSRLNEAIVLEDTSTAYLARYEIKVPESVRAVRDAGNWLEFLEAGGSPVLRMHYPQARDAQGLTRQSPILLRGLILKEQSHGPPPTYQLTEPALDLEVHMSLGGMQGPIILAAGWGDPKAMTTSRQEHASTLLPNGKILVTGGHSGSNLLNSAEIYDPSRQTWLAAGVLVAARKGHTATLLPNGKVLITGGTGFDSMPLATAELYDPNANAGEGRSSSTGNLVHARVKHTATLLPSGKVLVTGGQGLSNGVSAPLDTVELFDPSANQGAGAWELLETSMGQGRFGHTATLLPSGDVLITGGRGLDPNNSLIPLTSTGVYAFGNGGGWTSTGSLSHARAYHTATLVSSTNSTPPWKVLVVGGEGLDATNNPTPLNTTEAYDPASQTWSVANSMSGWPSNRSRHAATLLPSGKILVTGGLGLNASSAPEALASSLYIDPNLNNGQGGWSTTAATSKRFDHTATLLPSGEVLIAGGKDQAVLITSVTFDPDAGQWLAPPTMLSERSRHSATLMPSGAVLIAGGVKSSSETLNTADLYIPETGLWRSTTPMPSARESHAAVLLPSGKVLVVGGRVGNEPLSTAIIYDPAHNGSWSPTAPLHIARFNHTATVLASGKVLVVGGQRPIVPGGGIEILSTAELYDPATGLWTRMENSPARFLHTATLLRDGRVFIVGGQEPGGNGSSATTTATLYDPTGQGSWNAALPMSTSRYEHTATLLPSGQVLIVGGHRTPGNPNAQERAEIYTPSTVASENWSFASVNLPTEFSLHTATLLPAGKVLITGGMGPNGALNSSHVYDPVSRLWTSATSSGPTLIARSLHTATLLPTGQVLVVGGETSSSNILNSAQLYDALSVQSQRPPPIITNINRANSSLEFTLQGTNFQPIYEGSSSGGSQSSATNIPVVVLRAADGSGQWPLLLTRFTDTSLEVTLPSGTPTLSHYFFSVRVNSLFGGKVEVLDSTPPGKPEITFPDTGDVLNSRTPEFQGTAETGSTVTILLNGDVKGTTIATSTGWRYTPPADTPLQTGSYTMVVRATDAAGNTSIDSDTTTFSVDTTPPAVPILTAPAPGSTTRDNTPSFSGTADPGSTITVTVGSTTLDTTTIGTSRNWTIAPTTALPDGTYSVTAQAADAVGNSSSPSQSYSFTIDTSPPGIPEVLSPAPNATTRNRTPTYSGTADPDSTIIITVGSTTLVTTTIGTTNTWSIPQPSALDDGLYSLTVRAADAVGNSSLPSIPRSFTVDATPPAAPSVTAPSNGSTIANRTPVFSGTAEPGSTVKITVGLTEIGPALVDSSGNWNFTPSTPLVDGQYTVTAQAEDAADNLSPPSNAITFSVDLAPPAVPILTAPAPGSTTRDNTPSFSGTADPGSTITVTVGSTTLDTTTIGTSRNWTIAPTTALPDGTYSVTAQAADAVGNSSSPSQSYSFTIDTSPPGIPEVLSPAPNATTRNRTPTYSGTADPDSTIIITVGSTTLVTTTIGTTNTWSIPQPSALDDGLYSLTVRATDAVGNSSLPSIPRSFTVDATAPAVPSVTTPSNGSTIANKTPEYAGTADPGSIVKVTVGLAEVGSTTADASGDWRLTQPTLLSEGLHSVAAYAIDAVGNGSSGSNVNSFTVDTTPPNAPTVTEPSPFDATNDTTPTYEGTADPGSTVTLIVDGIPLSSSISVSSGRWSFTPSSPLDPGDHTVKAFARDALNNRSEDSNLNSFTVDTMPPMKPTVTTPADGSRTRETRPLYKGTSEPGSTVTVFVNDVVVGSGVTGADGIWEYSNPGAQPLPDNAARVIARARDRAGNLSDDSDANIFTVDTVPPDRPRVVYPTPGLLINDKTPIIEGTAEPFSSITVVIDEIARGTVTANEESSWRFEVTTPLLDGERFLKVRATDSVGNPNPTYTETSFILDSIPPPTAPIILFPQDNARLSTLKPTFKGTADPDTQVVVEVDCDVDADCITSNELNVRQDRTWEYTPATNLPPRGEAHHRVSAYSLDAAGNRTNPATILFRVDSIKPDPPMIHVPENVGAVFIISGTAEPLSMVTIYVDGHRLEPAVPASGSGTWDFTHTAPLADSTHVARATATDATMNVSDSSEPSSFRVDILAPAAPIVLSPKNGDPLKTATPIFRGTAEPGSTVTVTVEEKTCLADVSTSSNWQCTLATGLEEGEYSLSATATDKAGNKSAPTVPVSFTVSPQSPDLISPRDGDFINDDTPKLLGSANANNSIEVVVDGVLTFNTETDRDGLWSIEEVTPGLSEGPHFFTVTSTDSADNPSTSNFTFTVDLTPPDTLFALGSPSLTTYPPRASFEFSSHDELSSNEESTFECSFDGEVLPDCSSPYTLENYAEGEHTFSVRAIDKAGNKDPEPATFTWTRELAVIEGSGCNMTGSALSGLLAGLLLTLLTAGRKRRRNRANNMPGTSALLLLCLSLSPQVQAQEGPSAEALPASDVERLTLNPGRGSLLVGSGELLLPGTFRVAMATHYQRTPLRMVLEGQRLELIGHRVTALVTGALGVLPWLEVDLQVPVVFAQSGDNPDNLGLLAPASRGLGTPIAHARMGILSRRAGHVVDLSVDLGLGLPVGSSLALAREPLPRLQSNVLLGRRLGPLRATLDGGLVLRVPGRLGPEAITRSRLGQELHLGAALGTLGDGVRFESALRATLALETGQGSAEVFAGARYPLYPWLEVFGLGGVGLGSLPGTPGFRVLLGVAAGQPPPPDRAVVVRANSSQQALDDAKDEKPPRPLLPPTEPNDGT